MSPFTPEQEQEALELFKQGKTTAQVFRHFGATSIGQESEIMQEKKAIESVKTNPKFANQFTNLIGLGDATQVFGDAIARTKAGADITGTDVEANRKFIEAPTAGQLGGAALQTAALAASPAIAPVGMAASMVAGGALGYAYDIGSDLVAQKSMGETLTPGMGTAVGVVAPPALKGAFGVAKKIGEPLAKGLSNVVDNIELPDISRGTGVVKEAAADVGSRGKRLVDRFGKAIEERVETAERLKTATPAVREAIKTKVDEPIIEMATRGDKATSDAMKKMVEMAEKPKTARPTAGPASVASDTAVDQYRILETQRKTVGQQIGQMSDELPTLKEIDITPTQDVVIDVLQKNGITLDIDGKLTATDNLKVSDEQLSVLNKIWEKITSRQKISAKNLHELDQWFSGTQRKARVVDKIEDLYVKVPGGDGQEVQVPVYKFLRDVFGQRLDEVAPTNLRDLNRQYRSLSFLTDDIESSLVKNSKMETLQNVDISNPSALRRMFGEAQSAEDFRLIYEQMDTMSRQLGYKGARADELYYFANKLRDYYPETIPDTGLRGTIGSSIQDVVGSLFKAGEANATDQQKAIKMLLEMGVSD